MFLRLHHEISGMRIGVENGFGKFGKTADRGQGVEKQAGQHRARDSSLLFFRHGVLFSKERPAVDAWNCSIFGRPAYSVKSF